MARFVKAVVVVVACIGCLFVLFAMYVDRDVGHEDQTQVEQEIRAGLPLGSPISKVEGYLSEKGLQHSFESSSKTEYSIVHKIKGSNMTIIEDLGLQFHFDDALRLKSIETKIHFTGP